MKVQFFTMVSIPVSIRSVSGQYPITSGAMDCLTAFKKQLSISVLLVLRMILKHCDTIRCFKNLGPVSAKKTPDANDHCVASRILPECSYMTSSTVPAPLSSNVGERSPPSSEHLQSFLQHWTYGGRGEGTSFGSKTPVPHALYNVPRCLDNQEEKLPAVLLPVGDRSAIASTMIYSHMSTAWPGFSSIVPQKSTCTKLS